MFDALFHQLHTSNQDAVFVIENCSRLLFCDEMHADVDYLVHSGVKESIVVIVFIQWQKEPHASGRPQYSSLGIMLKKVWIRSPLLFACCFSSVLRIQRVHGDYFVMVVGKGADVESGDRIGVRRA